jgi:hypothetical protein
VFYPPRAPPPPPTPPRPPALFCRSLAIGYATPLKTRVSITAAASSALTA